MENRRKSYRDTVAGLEQKVELCAVNDLFEIQRLPKNILCDILDYLELESWKNARKVCHEWNDILSQSNVLIKFILRINNCSITPNKAPMLTFLTSKISFMRIEIGQNVTWKNEMELLEFFEIIGKKATFVTVLNKRLKDVPFWEKFPVIEVFTSPILSFWQKIPLTVKYFNVCKLNNFITATENSVIECILECKMKKMIIESVGIIKRPRSTDLEFIKVNDLLLKMVKDVGAEVIEISPINLHETRIIGFADIKKFANDSCLSNKTWSVNQSNKDIFWAHLKDMPKLEHISAKSDYTSSCFCDHALVKHFGIEEFEWEGNFVCDDCFITVFKSFPNLKSFTARSSTVGFDLILKQNQTLEKIHFIGILHLGHMLHIPFTNLNKLSNLTNLCLKNIEFDDVDFIKIFQKWPKMINLVELEISWMENEKFEDFYNFFSLCPNIKAFSFGNFDDVEDLVKLLKLWPQLEKLNLATFEQIIFDSKHFANSIAPHVRNLKYLFLLSYYDYEVDEEDDEEFQINSEGKDTAGNCDEFEKSIVAVIPSIRLVKAGYIS